MPNCRRCHDTKAVMEARKSVPCPACSVPVDPLPDETPIPFGRHQGTPLSMVPAAYLLWLLEDQRVQEFYPAVWEWIRRNQVTLQWERGRG
jgi:hypothetical protein